MPEPIYWCNRDSVICAATEHMFVGKLTYCEHREEIKSDDPRLKSRWRS